MRIHSEATAVKSEDTTPIKRVSGNPNLNV